MNGGLTGLSLCAGVGGLDLGVEIAFPAYRCIAAVENNPQAARRFRLRFPQAFVFRDVVGFDGRPLRGLVDAVVAGWPCFVAGTMVLTAAGYRPIENVAVGNLVLTHMGRWRRVTATMRRDGAPVVSLRGGGLPWTTCTVEHPFWAKRRALKWDNDKRRYTRRFREPTWIDAGNLSTNDFTGRRCPEVEAEGHSEAFWWVVGRYLADGWRVRRLKTGGGNAVSGDQGRVVICCAHGECAELEERIAAGGFTVSARSVERTVTKLHIVDQGLYRFLEQFGKYAHGKTIPRIALSLDAARARALIDGLFSGDGYTCRRTGNRILTTVSQSLALGAALLAQRAYGIVASVGTANVPDHTDIEGRTCNQRLQWRVTIPPGNCSAFVDGEWGWSILRSIKSAGTATVYNLAVEEDESYFANGAAVHNCQPHSVAGKRKGTADERWIWNDIARIVDEVKPAFFFGENVSGLLRDTDSDTPKDVGSGDRSGDGELEIGADESIGGMGTVLRDLAALGFVCGWGSLRASQVGASHGRPRVFILAVADRNGESGDIYGRERAGLSMLAGSGGEVLAYQPGRRLRIDRRTPGCAGHFDECGSAVADAGCAEGGRRADARRFAGPGAPSDDSRTGGVLADTLGGFVSPGERTGPDRSVPRIGGGTLLENPSRPDLLAGSGRSGRRGGVRGAGDEVETVSLGDAEVRDKRRSGPGESQARQPHRGPSLGVFAPGPSDPIWADILATSPHLAPALSPVTAALAIAVQQGTLDLQAETESGFRGLADRVARWLVERRPRLQCGGNGVVPLQAATVFTVLARRLGLTC